MEKAKLLAMCLYLLMARKNLGVGDGGVSDLAVEHLSLFTHEAGVIDENDNAMF